MWFILIFPCKFYFASTDAHASHLAPCRSPVLSWYWASKVLRQQAEWTR